MPTWADVVAAGRDLPEAEESTWFRTPCLRVRKKSFCRMKEDGETLVVRVVDLEDKDALLRSNSDVFFTTPHYDGYPYVLVRLAQVDPGQLRELIEDAWRLSAPKRVLAAFDARLRREQQPADLLRATAGRVSPSAAATIEPFMRMCHLRARSSGSAAPASPARPSRYAADRGEVVAAGPVDRVRRVRGLEHHVDERAALEVGLRNQSSKHVEDGQQAVGRRGGARLDLGLQPAPGPPLVAALEEGQHERLLGAEVAVERHPRHAGPLDDGVDPDRADAAPREQVVGGVEDALPRVDRRGHCQAT